jgi:hypothetical protein
VRRIETTTVDLLRLGASERTAYNVLAVGDDFIITGQFSQMRNAEILRTAVTESTEYVLPKKFDKWPEVVSKETAQASSVSVQYVQARPVVRSLSMQRVPPRRQRLS